MSLPVADKLRMIAKCIYIATEATVADDISAKTTEAADTIEALYDALMLARIAAKSFSVRLSPHELEQVDAALRLARIQTGDSA